MNARHNIAAGASFPWVVISERRVILTLNPAHFHTFDNVTLHKQEDKD